MRRSDAEGGSAGSDASDGHDGSDVNASEDADEVGDDEAATDSDGIAADSDGRDTDGDESDPVSALTGPVRRLHPRVRLVWLARAAVTALVLGGVVTGVERVVLGDALWIGPATGTLLLVVGASHALLRYRVWRYRLRDDSLCLERGVLTRVSTVVPYVRIQHVDTRRGPVARLTGLSMVVVYTAGSRGADVSIPGLAADRAEELQARLKRLAVVAEGDDAV